jgi:DNA primase
MPGRIRQEDVETVRDRADIVKVVSGYLQLKKTGRDSLTGLCPFHPEKTPSFSVSPAKQVYHCFGCGEGGNVFRFVEKIENLSFREVVERLANETGVTLRYEGDSPAERRAAGRREVLHRANAEAGRLFHRMLVEGREATDARGYLEQRGISPGSVERFAVGYAPAYPDFLLRRMSKAYSPEVLVEAGLVTRGDRGDLRDRFRGRLMFPIHDLSGNAVGFGARLLAAPGRPEPEGAKYLNTAESPVYRKGSLLYNLHRAKAQIAKTGGRAFVVEGYTDVIALDQAGIQTAVATCGTALGEDHFRLLSRFTDRVVLAFDSDDAGARAAERAYAFHQQYPVEVFVLILPAGKDPADFVLEHQEGAAERLEALTRDAVPLVEFIIGRAVLSSDLSTEEARLAAVRAGLAYVEPIENPMLRAHYAGVLAQRAGVGDRYVLEQLDRLVADRPGAVAPSSAIAGQGATDAGPRRSPRERVEREALRLLVQAPELCPSPPGALDPERFATPMYRKAFDFLREPRPGSNGEGPGSFVARAQDRGEGFGRLIAALAVEPTEADGEPTREYAEAVFVRLEELYLGRQIDELRRELERMNPQKDPTGYEDLFGQMVSLLGRRRRLSDG